MTWDRDAIGEVRLPGDVAWGVHTMRALENFAVDGPTMGDRPDVVRGYLQVKIAAARANLASAVLDPDIAGAIVAACRQLIDEPRPEAFPQALVQGGGGTPANMGVNEVVARLASDLLVPPARVHPNDHVNRSQSTNDTYPTVLHLVCVPAGHALADALDVLAATLDDLAAGHAGQERLGRTCLNDALPVPIDAVHRSQAHALRRLAADARRCADGLLVVPLGATAVGTGVGAPAGFAALAVACLAEETGLPLVPSPDPFDALANFDDLVALADVVERAAIVLDRLARDVRLLASGPRGGIGELRLPTVQVGSSIMPGKANPVIPELVMQVALQARGAAFVVRGAADRGELELNIMEPVVAAELPVALRRLAQATELFARRCVAGMSWDMDRVASNLEGSLLAVTEAAAREGHPC